jgi:hypothetical protein
MSEIDHGTWGRRNAVLILRVAKGPDLSCREGAHETSKHNDPPRWRPAGASDTWPDASSLPPVPSGGGAMPWRNMLRRGSTPNPILVAVNLNSVSNNATT